MRSLSMARHNWGIDALATDPIDTERLYLAVGMYTNEWDPNDGSILRSTDMGSTWQETVLPFKVGGNMPGRGVGEVSCSFVHQLQPAID
jgi:xyloglucan-specific exo-beta-1,4-glucanase